MMLPNIKTEDLNNWNKQTKTVPLGGIFADSIRSSQIFSIIDGVAVESRPLPYYSILNRLRLAWDVFRYKADAIYWYKQ